MKAVKNTRFFSKITSFAPHFAGVFTFALALFGGYTGYMNFFYDEPELILRLDSFQLKGFSDLQTIPDKLTVLEESFGEVTAGKILALRNKSTGINKFDSDSIKSLLIDVYKSIAEFQRPVSPWSVSEITYQNGVIEWPDHTSINIVTDGNSPYIFSDEYALVKSSPANPGATIISDIQRKAFYLYHPFGDPQQEKRTAVAKGLREIKTILEESQKIENYFLEVTVKVINKSRQQNLVWADGHLKIKSLDQKDTVDLPVTLVETSPVPSIGIHELTFRTGSLGEMKTTTQHKILGFFNKKVIQVSFTIIDLFGKPWNKFVKFSDNKIFYYTDQEIADLTKKGLAF